MLELTNDCYSTDSAFWVWATRADDPSVPLTHAFRADEALIMAGTGCPDVRDGLPG